jgi:hypothetical protein
MKMKATNQNQTALSATFLAFQLGLNSLSLTELLKKQEILDAYKTAKKMAAASKKSGHKVTATGRDYGPASTTKLTDPMAWRICFGDLKDETTQAIADKYGLSFGQIYSCRGGYTKKNLTAESFAS